MHCLLNLLLTAPPAFGHMGAHKGAPGLIITKDQALKKVFAGAAIERKTAYLTDEQAARIGKLAGCRFDSRVVSFYVAKSTGEAPARYAFFESHVVQHEPETIMVVVKPEGIVEEVHILAFQEPADYLPSRDWLGGFRGRSLEQISFVSDGLAAGAGSALAGQALTAGVRRLVAVFQAVRDH